MKIAFVLSGKSPVTMAGGIGSYAYSVGRIMHDNGYRVYIIGYSDRDETIESGFATLVHFKNPYARLLGLGAVLSAPLFTKKMEEITEREHPAEVIIFSAGIWGIAGGMLRKRLACRPVRVRFLASYFTTYEHEYGGQLRGAAREDYGFAPYCAMWLLYHFVRRFYTPLERRMLEASDRVVIHYDSSFRILKNAFPALDARKFAKIPYAVDTFSRTGDSRFVPERTSPQGPVVTVLCRQDPRKGINHFLKAVRILAAEGTRGSFLVVGGGFFLRRNMRLARRLGLSDIVRFTGYVASADDVLANTDVYVLPSLEEGAGSIGLLEAMKLGKAIVTTDCDGIPEDVVHEQTALLVPPGDARRLAAAIGRLMRDETLRRTLGTNAAAEYARKFTFEAMSRGVRDLAGGAMASASS